MISIETPNSAIYFNEDAYSKLRANLNDTGYSKVFVLVDNNTKVHCLAQFLERAKLQEQPHILEVSSGEEHKNFDSYVNALQQLSDHQADRRSLLINLGGGVVTDLGGFVASTFRRGIDFINVPTSLLAMVDASIGGKTGIDLGPLKNQVGTISLPKQVLIDTDYLETLPQDHFNSGLAEMLKHGLIYSDYYWEDMYNYVSSGEGNLTQLIYDSIKIKHAVVSEDPTEQGLRKTLNYGHTLGHAIESYYLENTEKSTLLHGEAIGIGLVLETYISHKQLGFPKNRLEEIKHLSLIHI